VALGIDAEFSTPMSEEERERERDREREKEKGMSWIGFL